jgi:hypothetical protein
MEERRPIKTRSTRDRGPGRLGTSTRIARARAATALLNSERPVDAPRDDTATLEI